MRTRLKKHVSFWAALCTLSLSGAAHAAIDLGATRVIFNGEDKSASLSIKNSATQPYVVQTWIEDGPDLSPLGSAHARLMVVPPLLRLDPGKETALRIVRSKGALPEDKETVFWLDVQEVPPKPTEPNVLQLALRSRIKIFYRPIKLAGTLDSAFGALSWHVVAGASGTKALRVHNPSAYHVTFSKISAMVKGGQPVELDPKDSMVAPGTDLDIALPTGQAAVDSVSASYINDFGGASDVKPFAIVSP
jgi:P pilus assembly chaperone PapD